MSADRPHLTPLAGVRPSLARELRGRLPQAGEEIIAAIRSSVPEYAQPLEGRFGRNVRTGVGQALSRFVDDIERPGAEDERWRLVYFNLGRGEVRQGRSLEALLAAYRVGARVSWRRIAEAAADAGAETAELTALAESIFAYIDEISAISAEGFAAEQAASAGESQRLRARAVRVLIDRTATAERVEDECAAAGWEAPPSAAALLTRDDRPASLAARIGEGVIAGSVADGVACAIVPDADSPGRLAEIASAVRGRSAAIGPAGDRDGLALSFERARLALSLIESQVLPGGKLIRADEHLTELIVGGDPALLSEHSRQTLAPLAEETDASRERLLETLAAWLAHPARPTEVARSIHVHPQTARYRLRRLREIFGEIDSRESRFRLELALRGIGR